MACPEERWQIVRYDMQKRKVLHTFDHESEAEAWMIDNDGFTPALYFVEQDPAAADATHFRDAG